MFAVGGYNTWGDSQDETEHYDRNPDSDMQDEDSYDQAEIESMLYSQIYFEQHKETDAAQTPEINNISYNVTEVTDNDASCNVTEITTNEMSCNVTEITANDTSYNVTVEEEQPHTSFASMVNYRGRDLISPAHPVKKEQTLPMADEVLSKKLKLLSKKDKLLSKKDKMLSKKGTKLLKESKKLSKMTPKLDKADLIETLESYVYKGVETPKSAFGNLLVRIKGKVSQDSGTEGSANDGTTKKKKKKKAKVVVISDTSEESNQSDESPGKRKRKGKIPVDKPSSSKKSKLLDSAIDLDCSGSSEIVISDSDEDLMFLDHSDQSEDQVDLDLNVKGAWQSFRDPVRKSQPVLSNIDISTWNGDPLLTVREVLQLLQNGSHNWKISDDDRYGLSRSYGTSNVRCHNCDNKGHLSRDCPKPKKMVQCILCGRPGHYYRRCPNTLCYNCDLSGHSSRDCDQPYSGSRCTCHRCGFYGHVKGSCPEIWREYHMTTKPGDVINGDQKENRSRYCYNCGKKGHVGDACELERMNEYTTPMSPIISRYSHNRHMTGSTKKNSKKSRLLELTVKATNVKVMQSLKGQSKSWTSKDNKKPKVTKSKVKINASKIILSLDLETKNVKAKNKVAKLKHKSEMIIKNLQNSGMKKSASEPVINTTTSDFNTSKQKKKKTKEIKQFLPKFQGTKHLNKLDKPKKSKKKKKKSFDAEIKDFPRTISTPKSDRVITIFDSPENVTIFDSPEIEPSTSQPKRQKKKSNPGVERKNEQDSDEECFITGINNVVSWWEDETVENDDSGFKNDPSFDNILNGCFKSMSEPAKNDYKQRKTCVADEPVKQGRFNRKKMQPDQPVKQGRFNRKKMQRLKTMFTQENYPQQDETNKKNLTSRAMKKMLRKELREKKKKLKNEPKEVEIIADSATPIPATNIGRRLLQNMGWSPGTGLGANNEGITSPITTYKYPRRQGLGRTSAPIVLDVD